MTSTPLAWRHCPAEWTSSTLLPTQSDAESEEKWAKTDNSTIIKVVVINNVDPRRPHHQVRYIELKCREACLGDVKQPLVHAYERLPNLSQTEHPKSLADFIGNDGFGEFETFDPKQVNRFYAFLTETRPFWGFNSSS